VETVFFEQRNCIRELHNFGLGNLKETNISHCDAETVHIFEPNRYSGHLISLDNSEEMGLLVYPKRRGNFHDLRLSPARSAASQHAGISMLNRTHTQGMRGF
jgi:hypothetical protein